MKGKELKTSVKIAIFVGIVLIVILSISLIIYFNTKLYFVKALI